MTGRVKKCNSLIQIELSSIKAEPKINTLISMKKKISGKYLLSYFPEPPGCKSEVLRSPESFGWISKKT